MKHWKDLLFMLTLIFCVILTGCNAAHMSENDSQTEQPGEQPGEQPDKQPDVEEKPQSEEASEDTQTATLYIGTQREGFSEYELSYKDTLTPEVLIQGIGDQTGWDLTLAEPVATGKGGMSVCLTGESSLFTGPPEPQKEEFHMYDGTQLAETILDSIQKTLQMGFTGEGGDPDALDIYFYMEGEQPLELPDLGLSWSLDEPYKWREPSAG